jgi:hypothetical protein
MMWTDGYTFFNQGVSRCKPGAIKLGRIFENFSQCSAKWSLNQRDLNVVKTSGANSDRGDPRQGGQHGQPLGVGQDADDEIVVGANFGVWLSLGRC